MDFVSDAFVGGEHFHVFAIVYYYSHEYLALIADTSLSGLSVTRKFSNLIAQHGKLITSFSDNGTKLTGMAVLKWYQETDIEHHCFQSGKPMQKGFVESFILNISEKCLIQTLITTLKDAKNEISNWKNDYNQNRSHSSLGNITPNEFNLKANLQNMAA